MVLGADRIVQLIREGVDVVGPAGETLRKGLVEGLDESQIAGIEGTTVDLRLDALLRPAGAARLCLDTRVTPRTEEVASRERGDRFAIIQPGDYLLAQTVEVVNLPNWLLGDLHSRTTLFRCGLDLKTAYISPNFQGTLTVGLKHVGFHPVEIELGFRILCLAFFEIAGLAVPYQGVWQGRRASTEGEIERPY